MTSEYKNFAELKKNEVEGKDYTIFHRETDSKIAVIAPHGGGIEIGTVDIADAIAGRDHSFYAFKGMKKTGNEKLHISSNRFDEPLGIKTSKNADIVISIHGWGVKKEMILIGGRHHELKQNIMLALCTDGFKAEISFLKGFLGIRPENICNRCRSGKGVQLEISWGFRQKMFNNIDRRALREKTQFFYNFVNCIRKAILLFHIKPS